MVRSDMAHRAPARPRGRAPATPTGGARPAARGPGRGGPPRVVGRPGSFGKRLAKCPEGRAPKGGLGRGAGDARRGRVGWPVELTSWAWTVASRDIRQGRRPSL